MKEEKIVEIQERGKETMEENKRKERKKHRKT
jgi:hypothetical protein